MTRDDVPHVVVHDYSGHPGQVELSRALARRGYRVTHQHCPSYVTGRGAVERKTDDPPALRFDPCPMDKTFSRYSYVRRVGQELSYGMQTADRIIRLRPDVAIISNVPLLGHVVISRRLSRAGIRMIFWHQDIYSAAIGSTARRRLGAAGGLVALVADRLERMVARRSDAIVAISPTFLEKLAEWGVAGRTVVVPNWAPIGELPPCPRRNAWSDRHGLSERPVVLYAGTLGLKHDPSVLTAIAGELAARRPGAAMVVVSEGMGRQWLEDHKRDHKADNLVLLDYQPYDELPSVLASADVLVVVLEPDASRYSVPSKALTYLCAGRAVLGVLPTNNAVAEILTTNGAGAVVDPSDRTGVLRVVIEMLDDEERRLSMGRAARQYAEQTFSVDRAADRFEAIFGPWLEGHARRAMPHADRGKN